MAMAESSSVQPVSTTTVTVNDNAPAQEKLVLRLRKPKTDKKVSWEEKVVDNEDMGKKSSKCCCIYSKPKTIRHDGESSDESSDDESGWDDCCHEHRMAGKRIPHKHPTTT